MLRSISHLTDLPAGETALRLGRLIADEPAQRRVLRAATNEPPRVRAMVGALSEAAGGSEEELASLRKTLNPTTRYDFGPLSVLPSARGWGAR